MRWASFWLAWSTLALGISVSTHQPGWAALNCFAVGYWLARVTE